MAAQLYGALVTNGGTNSIDSAGTHATNGHAPPKVSDLDGKAPAPSDWANYFCTYAYLYHQVRPQLLHCRWSSLSLSLQ